MYNTVSIVTKYR